MGTWETGRSLYLYGSPGGSLCLTGGAKKAFSAGASFVGLPPRSVFHVAAVAEPGEFDVQGVRDDGFQAVKCDAKVGGALATAEQEHLTGNGLEGFHLVTCLDD